MPKRRIFIAIQIPDELKNIAEFYLEPFSRDKNVRIPKKEGWHITVIFCGYFDEKEIEELKKITKNAALEFKSFEFVPQKILFAPPSRSRMIWLDFSAEGGSASGGKNSFAKLKLAIEDEMIKRQKDGFFKNFRLEKREPKPHLTLARFDERHFVNIKDFLPKDGIDLTKETAPFLVKNIDIMESHLSRSGAEYELIKSF